jgi:hypothetical protein
MEGCSTPGFLRLKSSFDGFCYEFWLGVRVLGEDKAVLEGAALSF